MEPQVFRDVEKEVWKLINQFTTPNIIKYVILNKEAYKELVDYYAEFYGIEEYPETILNNHIVLDVDSTERVKVVSNCYTEFCLRMR